MGTYHTERKIFEVAGAAADSTGDKGRFSPVVPIDIIRWGYLVDTTALDVGAGFTVAIDHQPTANSASGRVAIDTIVRTTDLALGKGVVKELILAVSQVTAEDGSLRDVSGTGPFQVDPGESVVFEVTDAADTTGTVKYWFEYYELPQNLDTRNTDNITVVTA